ncbi:MAG TPA: nucleotidyltransferase family protein, partial [Bryobacteraceae bacterium]|nr:nucleotidyltransferase family protein [Bryobacteraceae bacterium]
RAHPFIAEDEHVLVGLPDTIWYPEDGFRYLEDGVLSFLLFPVERPEFFDAVVTDDSGRVLEVQVKSPEARSKWVWGAFQMPARVLRALYGLWLDRDRKDEYIGTLVNAYLAQGGVATGVHAGRTYVDVGTVNGYREAMRMMGEAYERV